MLKTKKIVELVKLNGGIFTKINVKISIILHASTLMYLSINHHHHHHVHIIALKNQISEILLVSVFWLRKKKIIGKTQNFLCYDSSF